MNMDLKDVCDVLSRQRNLALDEVATLSALNVALQRYIAELEQAAAKVPEKKQKTK